MKPIVGAQGSEQGDMAIQSMSVSHPTIRALVTDDHAVIRRGLKELLAESRRIEVAGEASTAREALDQVRAGRWDVLILDINLPDKDGLDLLRELKAVRPDLPVLILTVCSEDQFAVRALRSGAADRRGREGRAGWALRQPRGGRTARRVGGERL